MKIKNLKMIKKKSLVSKFTVYLDRMGISINDCNYFDNGENQWISMPSRQYEKDGEKKYFGLVYIDKEKKEAFDAEAIPMVLKEMARVEHEGEESGAKKDNPGAEFVEADFGF